MFWGTTPALDLQETYKDKCKTPKELNILIFGGSDARHILKTISQLYQHETIKINFYIMEICVELYARELLLLNIALELPDKLGLMLKTKIFMEIYGNTLLRPEAATYLTSKAKQLVNMITNLDYCYDVLKMVNLDRLKYKEREYMEVLFKYWCSPDPFFICELWDRRLRQTLGLRYDSRMGVFDWDLHMRLHQNGATQICSQEYKHWRETGVAFTWLDSDVSKPNRTLAAGAVRSGEKYLHHGYLGDLVTGPFVTYGLHCKDAEMLKQANHMNINRATDITEYNLMQLFHEIIYKEESSYKNINNLKMGTVFVDLPNKRIVENQNNLRDNFQDAQNFDTKCFDVENISIKFLSQTLFEHLKHKDEYKKLFNIIYFSNLVVEKVDSNVINAIASKDCLLIIENVIYVPCNTKEHTEAHDKKITEKTNTLENIALIPFDCKKDPYAMFIIT